MANSDLMIFLAVVLLGLGVVVTILFGVIITLRRGQRGAPLGPPLVVDQHPRMAGHPPPTPVHR